MIVIPRATFTYQFLHRHRYPTIGQILHPSHVMPLCRPYFEASSSAGTAAAAAAGAAAARAASTQRGRMYLKPGARGLVAAAALRTAHWPAPGAP